MSAEYVHKPGPLAPFTVITADGRKIVDTRALLRLPKVRKAMATLKEKTAQTSAADRPPR
jgi:hypothetical protein